MKTVISASRRTDMPAHYLDRLIACIRQGFAEVPNPYSGKPYRIGLDEDDVHTIVLWSKNFGPFLKGGHALNPYSLYFLFTINDMPGLESGVPPLSERFDQLDELAARYGPERIGWRFDPVVFRNGRPVMGIDTFERLADRAAKAGVSRVITSFLDMYGKVKKRNETLNLCLADPPDDMKRSFAEAVAACG